MGEAKRRGNREKRTADAVKLVERLRPTSIECEHCGKLLADVDYIPGHHDPDLEALFGAKCQDCESVSAYPCYTPAGMEKIRRWIKEEEATGSDQHLLIPDAYIRGL